MELLQFYYTGLSGPLGTRNCSQNILPSDTYLPCGLRRGGHRVHRYLWQAVKHYVGGRLIPLWPGWHKTCPMRSELHQRQLSVGTLLGCRLLQPLHGFIFVHRHSVTIAIADAKIVLSRSVAVTSRSCDPLGGGCAALSDPVSDLVSHSHLERRRIISIYCPST